MQSPSLPNHVSSSHSHSLPVLLAWNILLLPASGRASPLSSLISGQLALSPSQGPLAPPCLAEAALMTSLQASLLPGTHFLIDLSEPSALGDSSSWALLAAAFSSSPALALLPGLHTPLPGLTFLLSTCHWLLCHVCPFSRSSLLESKAFVPFGVFAQCLSLGASTGSVVERTQRSCLAVVWGDLVFIVPVAAPSP